MEKDGVVDLLSKSLFTSRSSNFVKLVKGSVTSGKLATLLGYDVKELQKDEEKSKNYLSKLQKISNDLVNYLQLTKTGNTVDDNTVGEVSRKGETLKRNKNFDLNEKLTNSRLIDKLKVLVTVWLVALIFKKTVDLFGEEDEIGRAAKTLGQIV